MVYYRKYRPQTIKELDSEDVRQKLDAVLRSSAPTFLQVPHAFLFTGPKGLGKTSTARIVAKVINCTGRKDTSGKDIEPCNECEQCISITNGTNMDILEIDAASNRGIDEMRDLKEKVRLAPLSAKKKVYIIDEVHMLTTEAFNALLKTLEEPPSHAVFILCTTESHKIPPTILSRCFHIAFKLATEEELVRAFKRIVKGENIEVDDSTLRQIARLAEGGFRDGTKILEELVALSGGGKITPELLEEKYQMASIGSLNKNLLKALESRDLPEALRIISELTKQGIDTKYFLSAFIEELHTLLLGKAGVMVDRQQETSLSLEELTLLVHLFSTALSDTKYAVVSQLPAELAVITWCQSNTESSGENAELGKRFQEAAASRKEKVTISTLRKQAGSIAKHRAVNGESKKETVRDKREPAEVSILKYTASGDPTPEWVSAFWKNFISGVKSHNHTIAGVLNSCTVKSYDRKSLVIEAAYAFHKERLEESKTHTLLQNVCEELVGNPVAVTVELRNS